MYSIIRQALLDLLNGESITKIKQAYRTEVSEISAYPVAIIAPSEHDADYHQTSPSSNKETYIFTIRVIYPFTEGQATADLALEQALDELIGVLRDKTCLGSAADWIKPVPGRWGYEQREGGVMRIAELNVQAVKYVG
ncbi:MAG TPA: hypothetical protein PKG74_00440 [Candidatus Colwellbacteria bacterium]|nr:hypothetical protein [Candidatus Colwellbacteria bacterium]